MSVEGTGKKQYAPILPAPDSGSSGSMSGQAPMSELHPKREKRTGTGRFACDACRARKSAVRIPYFPLPYLCEGLVQEKHLRRANVLDTTP